MKTNLCFYHAILGVAIYFFMPFDANAQWWQNWERYDDNPILSGPISWADLYFGPQVIHDEDGYKMWFTGKLSGMEYEREIGYAVSDDGLDWDVHPEPVIPHGDPTDWDYEKFVGAVLNVDDTLRMWYTGMQNGLSVGYAWSTDGENWQLNPDPVFEGVMGGPVYYDGSVYHMYYSVAGNIYYASSSDGFDWEEENEGIPVITRGPSGSWYADRVFAEGLVMQHDTLNMFFRGDSDGFSRIGHAWSMDYVNWQVYDEPVLDVIPGDDYESKGVVAGTVLYEDHTFKMWYDAIGNLNEFTICYADVKMDSTCLAEGYDVNTQSWIDLFPTNYAYCNDILGDLTISGADISNFNGLSKVEYLDGDLEVYTNPLLESFGGFDNLQYIGNKFMVLNNETLSSLQGLESLNGIGDDVLITMNPVMESLDGLENLTAVGGDLEISENINLEDIHGIANVDTSTFKKLTITDNENLSWCSVMSVCDFILDPYHEDETTISGNTGQCDSFNVVYQICFVDIPETFANENISVAPNPFSRSIAIAYETGQSGYLELSVYNSLGRQVAVLAKGVVGKGEHQLIWNAEGFPAGMYFCVLSAPTGTETIKLVKLE